MNRTIVQKKVPKQGTPTVLPKDGNTKEKKTNSKDATMMAQDDLDYAHNIYLLAFATTKMQENTLSELRVKNEDQQLAVLMEIEKKRMQLAKLKEIQAAFDLLTKEHTTLKNQKEAIAPIVDNVSAHLKEVDLLKDSIPVGLPIKGFAPESDPENLKSVLSETRRVLNTTLDLEEFNRCANAVGVIEKHLLNIVQDQNRCEAACKALNSAVLEETVLKAVKIIRSSSLELLHSE